MSRRPPAWLPIAAATCLLAVAVRSPTPASGAAAPDARLQGTFAMSGRLVRARHVLGERKGQLVSRAWGFTPGCSSGACKTVTMLRQRETGAVDRLSLRRTAAGRYQGKGRFYVPLSCKGATVPHGGLVIYQIKVLIGAAASFDGQLLATGVSGRYASLRRVNLTRCPGGIGLDEALYSGSLLLGAPLPAPGPPPPPPPGTSPPPGATSPAPGAAAAGA